MSFFVNVTERTGRYGDRYVEREPRLGRIIFCGVLLAIFILAAVLSIAPVPTGHTGVVTTFGKVENYTLDAGFHVKAPWQRVIRMDNRVQRHTTELSCFSSDIQEVSMLYTINYQISHKDAMTIYSTIGRDYYNVVIAPTITESIKTVAAKYTAEDLINDRTSLAQGIEDDLAVKLQQHNIILVSTSIEDMDFTDVFTNAVEAKQVAAQNKLKAETEAQQKIVEAEAAAKQKIIETEAAAEARKVAADAEAYEISAKAAAEAEANKKLAESITPELNEYRYYDIWDGVLPKFVAGGNEGIMLQIPTE